LPTEGSERAARGVAFCATQKSRVWLASLFLQRLDRYFLEKHNVIVAVILQPHIAEVGPRAVLLDRCRAGNRVILKPGATIGSDGFGWAFVDGALRKIPQVGYVELGDDVEIGANTCIDRAQTGVTSVGDGTKIDNLCQIGHNSRIGKHTAIAAMTGMAGTTIIGDYVQVGGQAAFKGHVTVGSRVIIAGASHIWGDVPDGVMVSGRPARAHRDELRGQALLRKLPKLFARVDALEGSVGDNAE